MIREILRKNDVYQKPLPEMGKILTGGLVVLEGEKWAKHRKIVNPAFHLDKLKVSVKQHKNFPHLNLFEPQISLHRIWYQRLL